MSRVALWLVALLLVGLSGASLVEEVLVGDPGRGCSCLPCSVH